MLRELITMTRDAFASGVEDTVLAMATSPLPKVLLATPIVLFDHMIASDTVPVVALAIILFLDFVLGVAVALKRRVFSSAGLLRGLGKVLVYMIVLLVSSQIALMVPDVLGPLPQIMYGYLGLTELASVLENTSKLGYRVPVMSQIFEMLARRSLPGSVKDLPQGLDVSKLSEDELEALMTGASAESEKRKLTTRRTKPPKAST